LTFGHLSFLLAQPRVLPAVPADGLLPAVFPGAFTFTEGGLSGLIT
jgi:hypothetical protein